jgi:signal transduction histidine kinase
MLSDICEYLREAHEKARNMAGGLCPVRLEENGLSCAIEELSLNISRMYNIKCEYRNYNSNIKIYNSQIAINMYYIVREAVNNAVKHGKAGDIEITYSSNADTIFLLKKDDGEGFDTARNESPGMGLSLIKYRARAIGGSVEIKSGPGSGTSVLRKLPRINNKKNEWDGNRKL